MTNKLLIGITLAFVAVPTAYAVRPAASATGQAPHRPGEVLVKYRASAGTPEIAAMKQQMALTSRYAMLDGRMELLALPSFMTMTGAMKMLALDPSVEYVEPNYLRRPNVVLPNDPLFTMQWGLNNTGQPNFVVGGPPGTIGADLNLINAWDANDDGVADRTGRGNVIIAVIDDAIETTHPDLAANMVAGFDAADNDSNPNPTNADENHGTWVSGAVAAVGNNGVGISGAAWNERIMPLRFGFDVASEVRALDFARTNGASIVNASYGGPTFSRGEFDAIAALNTAGILFVTSAGNQNASVDFAGAAYPANYRLPNVATVAATNRQDGIASFSGYGAVTVPFAAPGLQIVTTAPGGGYTMDGVNGTSFSAPYVAGVAGLIRDYLPATTPRQVIARLIESGEVGLDPTSPANLRTAAGRIDADAALEIAARPSIVIRPVQSSTYGLQFSATNVVDVPVFVPVTVEDGGNRTLDPGETTTVRITLENLWLDATNVRATLSATGGATGGATVNSGTVSFGNLPSGTTQIGDFNVSVASTITGHQYLPFSLAVVADGGYSATRRFVLETGLLRDAVTVNQSIQTDQYDEFHTWTYDVTRPAAAGETLTFQTTGRNDIDFYVRYGQPAQYNIDLGADPTPVDENSPQPFSFVNVVDAQRGDTSLDGNETVTIAEPLVGTYYVTVINFDRTPNAAYTLRAAFNAAPGGGTSGGTTGGTTGGSTGGTGGGTTGGSSGGSTGGSTGGDNTNDDGGGAIPPTLLGLLALLALVRRRAAGTARAAV